MSEPEIIDISNFDSNDTINISGPRLSTFGSGIELLMNDKKISANSSTKVDIEDLNQLESELNDLSKEIKNYDFQTDINDILLVICITNCLWF